LNEPGSIFPFFFTAAASTSLFFCSLGGDKNRIEKNVGKLGKMMEIRRRKSRRKSRRKIGQWAERKAEVEKIFEKAAASSAASRPADDFFFPCTQILNFTEKSSK
jgi:hypothetical protein